ncbi:hypothetical protein VNI00_017761 [Paramarasmius palmivorus]|uniref:Uncharacterized protein n=1 Tax=Paramarasmius palmivorus TaxID=297713 RepID=A0AAW0B6A3_9AGAR
MSTPTSESPPTAVRNRYQTAEEYKEILARVYEAWNNARKEANKLRGTVNSLNTRLKKLDRKRKRTPEEEQERGDLRRRHEEAVTELKVAESKEQIRKKELMDVENNKYIPVEETSASQEDINVPKAPKKRVPDGFVDLDASESELSELPDNDNEANEPAAVTNAVLDGKKRKAAQDMDHVTPNETDIPGPSRKKVKGKAPDTLEPRSGTRRSTRVQQQREVLVGQSSVPAPVKRAARGQKPAGGQTTLQHRLPVQTVRNFIETGPAPNKALPETQHILPSRGSRDDTAETSAQTVSIPNQVVEQSDKTRSDSSIIHNMPPKDDTMKSNEAQTSQIIDGDHDKASGSVAPPPQVVDAQSNQPPSPVVAAVPIEDSTAAAGSTQTAPMPPQVVGGNSNAHSQCGPRGSAQEMDIGETDIGERAELRAQVGTDLPMESPAITVFGGVAEDLPAAQTTPDLGVTGQGSAGGPSEIALLASDLGQLDVSPASIPGHMGAIDNAQYSAFNMQHLDVPEAHQGQDTGGIIMSSLGTCAGGSQSTNGANAMSTETMDWWDNPQDLVTNASGDHNGMNQFMTPVPGILVGNVYFPSGYESFSGNIYHDEHPKAEQLPDSKSEMNMWETSETSETTSHAQGQSKQELPQVSQPDLKLGATSEASLDMQVVPENTTEMSSADINLDSVAMFSRWCAREGVEEGLPNGKQKRSGKGKQRRNRALEEAFLDAQGDHDDDDEFAPQVETVEDRKYKQRDNESLEAWNARMSDALHRVIHTKFLPNANNPIAQYIPYPLRKWARANAQNLVECGKICPELTLMILTTREKMVRCITHHFNDKSGDKTDEAERIPLWVQKLFKSAYTDTDETSLPSEEELQDLEKLLERVRDPKKKAEILRLREQEDEVHLQIHGITGIPTRKVSRGELLSGFFHCGCSMINAIKGFYLWKILQIYSPVLDISEGFKRGKPTTRTRQFLIQAYEQESHLDILEMFDYELKNVLGQWQYVKVTEEDRLKKQASRIMKKLSVAQANRTPQPVESEDGRTLVTVQPKSTSKYVEVDG